MENIKIEIAIAHRHAYWFICNVCPFQTMYFFFNHNILFSFLKEPFILNWQILLWQQLAIWSPLLFPFLSFPCSCRERLGLITANWILAEMMEYNLQSLSSQKFYILFFASCLSIGFRSFSIGLYSPRVQVATQDLKTLDYWISASRRVSQLVIILCINDTHTFIILVSWDFRLVFFLIF